MPRTAVILLSERQEDGQVKFDRLRIWLFAIHLFIVAYVGAGWMIYSRPLLYFYTLLLPGIVLQWLFNGGCSVVHNVENLIRTGHWNDPRNGLQGAFFSTLLQAGGIRASEAQITTALCSLMLIFWLCAVCRLMLINA